MIGVFVLDVFKNNEVVMYWSHTQGGNREETPLSIFRYSV